RPTTTRRSACPLERPMSSSISRRACPTDWSCRMFHEKPRVLPKRSTHSSVAHSRCGRDAELFASNAPAGLLSFPLTFGLSSLACSLFWSSLDTCNRPEIRSVSVLMTRAPRCASGEKQWEMQQGTIHGKHQVRGQPSICITNCAECDGARRRRSRRDDAGGNHARQRALDCPHQNTNDVGFRPFLTCSIAARDNDGGGAPEAIVIPPCNSAYTRKSKIST